MSYIVLVLAPCRSEEVLVLLEDGLTLSESQLSSLAASCITASTSASDAATLERIAAFTSAPLHFHSLISAASISRHHNIIRPVRDTNPKP